MRKFYFYLIVAICCTLSSQLLAQVNDVNFMVSGTGSYNSWNKKLNLESSPAWGLKAGFSFGPAFQLSGVYERSLNLKAKLKGDAWKSVPAVSGINWSSDASGVKLEMERIGAEARLNIAPNATLTPFLTAGTGVMSFKYDSDVKDSKFTDQRVYTSFGAGLKINFSRRVALSLEGRDLIFGLSEPNPYLASNKAESFHNWGGQASLDIFFGGTKVSDDEISRAYYDTFSDGFNGAKFVLEPGVAYIDFEGTTAFKDQWFFGGSAGFDFNSYVGIRGFYYKATSEPNKLNLKYSDGLTMYGGNFIARLNVPRGVTPYLSIGAGYLDVKKEDYQTANGLKEESGWFAMGGAGLEIPFGRHLALFGTANAMLNSHELLDKAPVSDKGLDLSKVKISMMYQAGLRINLGAKSKSGKEIFQEYVDNALAEKEEVHLAEINELRAANEAKMAELRAEYETQISDLNAECEMKVSNLNAQLQEAQNKVVVIDKLAPKARRSSNNKLYISAKNKEAKLSYRTPEGEWQEYTEPVVIPADRLELEVRATLGSVEEIEKVLFPYTAKRFASENLTEDQLKALLDGNDYSIFDLPSEEKSIVLTTEEPIEVKSIVYTPNQWKNAKGHIQEYELYLDGELVAQGTFEDIAKNPNKRTISLEEAVTCQTIELKVISLSDDAEHLTLSGIEIF